MAETVKMTILYLFWWRLFCRAGTANALVSVLVVEDAGVLGVLRFWDPQSSAGGEDVR